MAFDKAKCPCDCKGCHVCGMFGIAEPVEGKPVKAEAAKAQNERTVEDKAAVQMGLFDSYDGKGSL